MVWILWNAQWNDSYNAVWRTVPIKPEVKGNSKCRLRMHTTFGNLKCITKKIQWIMNRMHIKKILSEVPYTPPPFLSAFTGQHKLRLPAPLPLPLSKILQLFKYNYTICSVGQRYRSNVRRTVGMQPGNVVKAWLSHFVAWKAGVGLSLKESFEVHFGNRRMHTSSSTGITGSTIIMLVNMVPFKDLPKVASGGDGWVMCCHGLLWVRTFAAWFCTYWRY